MGKRKVTDCAEGCPVEAALDLIGGKWKGVILYHLLKDRVLRFGELRRLLPGVTQRMLTKQLRELERDGILTRTVHAEVPPRVEYALTEMGKSLKGVIRALESWGNARKANART
ncbi:putative HTH-type transcriptional regulator YybR [Aquisphaera giovannonii]|uniref:Putative HTH-type transcriptional regulator YybR n=1 Tax=Aquisphaera giovannonii TaxID=406548 RepID=A0A5B9VWC5_9BACT|nr:helix-turn-helix domain-containing protein [Aquisphaera giovannonii]QEH32247.1 putative HTH-type transcriptional regulator YybR [Aquisphaera giovannonii]